MCKNVASLGWEGLYSRDRSCLCSTSFDFDFCAPEHVCQVFQINACPQRWKFVFELFLKNLSSLNVRSSYCLTQVPRRAVLLANVMFSVKADHKINGSYNICNFFNPPVKSLWALTKGITETDEVLIESSSGVFMSWRRKWVTQHKEKRSIWSLL